MTSYLAPRWAQGAGGRRRGQRGGAEHRAARPLLRLHRDPSGVRHHTCMKGQYHYNWPSVQVWEYDPVTLETLGMVDLALYIPGNSIHPFHLFLLIKEPRMYEPVPQE